MLKYISKHSYRKYNAILTFEPFNFDVLFVLNAFGRMANNVHIKRNEILCSILLLGFVQMFHSICYKHHRHHHRTHSNIFIASQFQLTNLSSTYDKMQINFKPR